MSSIVPEFRLDWGLGTEEDAAPVAPRGRRADGALDAITSDSRKAQQKVGQARQPGPSRRAHIFSVPAARDGPPAGTGLPARGHGDKSLRQGFSQQECRGLEALPFALGHNPTN